MLRLPYSSIVLAATLTGSAAAQVSWTEFPARLDAAIGEDDTSPRLIMFGGQTPEGETLAETWTLDTLAATSSWTRLPTNNSPPPTRNHAMVRLPGTGLVMFGGELANGNPTNETWVFDGNSWGHNNLPVMPAPRSLHALALDEGRNRIVMYGGEGAGGAVLSDTWEFGGAGWTEYFPVVSPGPQSRHSMAYQGFTGTVLLVEKDALLGVPSFAWRYDGANHTWSSIPGPGSFGGYTFGWRAVKRPGGSGEVVMIGGSSDMFVQPQIVGGTNGGTGPLPAIDRNNFHVAYDSVNDRVFLQGGSSSGNIALNSTLVFDTQGIRVHAGDGSPDGRIGHALVVDPAGSVLLTGGLKNDHWHSNSEFETWKRSGQNWIRLASTLTPPPMAYHATAHDSLRGRSIVFGGFYFAVPMPTQLYWGWTWEWDGADWILASQSGPPARSHASMAFDEARSAVILFGGRAGSTQFGDTWEWDGTAWAQLNPPTSPSPRHLAGLCQNVAAGSLLLFGGLDGAGTTTTSLNDTWEWDGSTWLQQAPANRPPAGYSAWRTTLDRARARVVAARNDEVWEWDGSDWIERFPVVTGYARSPIVFAASTGKVVTFGSSGSTWEYGPLDPASVTGFGVGCPGGAGVVELAVVDAPWIDHVARYELQNPNGYQPAFGVIGLDKQTWNGNPLPMPLGAFGLTACFAFIRPDISEFLPTNEWPIAIPNAPVFVGLRFFMQAAIADPMAPNPARAIVTNALDNIIGAK